jgi:predicted ATPase
MGYPLEYISIKGFKSIRNLDKFKLEQLNILIGANGAGKSNFVDFFRMLRAMTEKGLANFITKKGGADGFFFGGPKETPQIEATITFGPNQYNFILEPTATNQMMVKEESTNFTGTYSSGWRKKGGGKLESELPNWKDLLSSISENKLSIEAYVYDSISSWIVYHFHDTSALAPMRRDYPIYDKKELNPDASNIAAFLLKLKQTDEQIYQRIRETIQLIAPFFDDFILESENKGQDEIIRLQWRQKGSSFPFQPWHLSDGTLRFICLATALLQPNLPSTIVIDEPELGLHPFALEVIANLFRETSEKTQLIVSTQSPTLLNHFNPHEVIVVDREGNASRFRRLEEKPLMQWLEDFTLGELWQKNVFDGGPSYDQGVGAG